VRLGEGCVGGTLWSEEGAEGLEGVCRIAVEVVEGDGDQRDDEEARVDVCYEVGLRVGIVGKYRLYNGLSECFREMMGCKWWACSRLQESWRLSTIPRSSRDIVSPRCAAPLHSRRPSSFVPKRVQRFVMSLSSLTSLHALARVLGYRRLKVGCLLR
jgi:hypothetical protein